jgi:hypothetical protein
MNDLEIKFNKNEIMEFNVGARIYYGICLNSIKSIHQELNNKTYFKKFLKGGCNIKNSGIKYNSADNFKMCIRSNLPEDTLYELYVIGSNNNI